MKAFVSRAPSGIESLAIEDLPAPGPITSGQIRIAMRAASINYRDTMALSGAFGAPGPQGLIPCSDGAGEVAEVAPDVSRFKVGERVWGSNQGLLGRQGTFAELAAVQERIPELRQEPREPAKDRRRMTHREPQEFALEQARQRGPFVAPALRQDFAPSMW